MSQLIAVIAGDAAVREQLIALVRGCGDYTVQGYAPTGLPAEAPALYVFHLPAPDCAEAQLFASMNEGEEPAIKPAILVSGLPAYAVESIPHASGLLVAAVSEPVDAAALADTISFLLG